MIYRKLQISFPIDCISADLRLPDISLLCPLSLKDGKHLRSLIPYVSNRELLFRYLPELEAVILLNSNWHEEKKEVNNGKDFVHCSSDGWRSVETVICSSIV